MSATSITSPLTLPCGAVLKNRIAKGAMTEGLADSHNMATDKHVKLYGRWADGGSGMLLTGNVQVDGRYLERPGNVVIDGPQSNEKLSALAAFAEAGTRNDTHLWMQLSHAGRQTPATVTTEPVAPSAIEVKMPGGQFGKPRALTEEEILDVIERFAFAAGVAKDTGFSGVQIHAAHGYLISEFLNPLVNQRTDQWGGSLQNRARLLMDTVKAVREKVGSEFPISVKLNSSDFQKGGFSHSDSIEVAKWLDEAGLDLLEVSGGNYEQPVMMDTEGFEPVYEEKVRSSTRKREAYFLEYAADIAKAVKNTPLMVTGGFRTVDGMDEALSSGDADVVGIARPLCVEADLPQQMMDGKVSEAKKWEKTFRLGPTRFLGPNSPIDLFRGLNAWGAQGWYCLQLIRMGEGLDPDTGISTFKALRMYMSNEQKAAKAMNAARAA
ncbi:MAG: NADH:flavin oxidoreductase/NADH oxidase family protein [Candidatus Phaeomarinobacter sp.]